MSRLPDAARIAIVASMSVLFAVADLSAADWPGRKGAWRGYDRFDFSVDDHACYVVTPKQAADGRPWVWRARFPDYHAEMDVTLLGKGFHVAYVDVAGLFGAPQAVDRGDKFYALLTEQHGLARKVVLEGVSRGGLFIYNWAARNPDKVACIYADTPVCDITSWPAGWGGGRGHGPTWAQCLKVYGMTADEARRFRGNPIDQAETIARAAIPLLHVVATNDTIVPPVENTYLLRDRLRQHGGDIDVIVVPQGTAQSSGHHFDHPDPQRVVEFVLRHAG